MFRTFLLTIGAIAITTASFYGGIYYSAAGRSLPFAPSGGGSPAVQYDSVTGQVSSVADSSITLTLPDGTQKTLLVDADTRVMSAPTVQSYNTLRVGMSVLAAFPAQAGATQMIQILSPALPAQ